MMFRDLNGKMNFVLHFLNDKYQERLIFVDVTADENGFILDL